MAQKEPKWSDLSYEGEILRKITKRIHKRFKKHIKNEDDDLAIKSATALCTVVNAQRRIVDGIKYEKRLEEIELILRNIPPDEIAKAKARIGV